MRAPTVIAGCLLLAASCAAQSLDWKDMRPKTSFPARGWHEMTYDISRARTVLFGGSSTGRSNALLGDTWEWSGTGWTRIKPSTSPAARWAQGMAYDLVRRRTVLFGGQLSDTATNRFRLVADTWEYDGTNWTRVKTASSPLARHAEMTYDVVRQRTVLFGGFNGSPMGDTWEYDGKNWRQVWPTTSPPARAFHGMVYDLARARTVLFGGTGPGGGADTWEYDGKTWTQIKTATAPPRRYYVAMVYDSVRERTVLFGGMSWNGRTTYDDTWEYDGKNWARVRPGTSPSARSGAGIAFDSRRRRTVLTGGTAGATSFPVSDTWEYVATPQLIATPATLSIATGGTQALSLKAGAENRRSSYWIFGSMTGTKPGLDLFGVNIPLVPDAYTDIALGAVNSKELANFKGTLDAAGTATASLHVPARLPVPPGFRLYHAFVVYRATSGRILAASNPVSVEFK